MCQRVNISQLEPEAYKAMFGLEGYLRKTDLTDKLKELIKTRASQINGCAFCIQMHTEQARKNGETAQRLYALSAWKDSPLFSEEERAVLALTEEVTLISQNGLTENTYSEALKHLGEQKLAQAIMQISVINTWNRIAISTHIQH